MLPKTEYNGKYLRMVITIMADNRGHYGIEYFIE